MNVFRCTVYLYFHIFKQRNQNIQHHFFYHFQFFHLIRPKHTICFYSMIQKFKLFIDILFIYICKPFSYTSIRAQTRENYKINLITEGTFFLKCPIFHLPASNWLVESAEINTHVHVQNFINKKHIFTETDIHCQEDFWMF